MEPLHALFLQAVKAALENRQVSWNAEVTPQQYTQMLELAENHHVLPLFFEATYTSTAASALPPAVSQRCRQSVLHAVTAQSIRTENLLALLSQLRQKGHRVLVVKGAVCRHLYPNPDHRTSADEDLLCDSADFSNLHDTLLGLGLTPGAGDLDGYEVPYTQSNAGLYIELHKSLFSPDSDVTGDYNAFFSQAFQHADTVCIQGQPVQTLCCTDHLLYLIIHAYKHFLHSGFGIRQVCDIALFANTYGPQIDWTQVVSACEALRAGKFAAALFRIGQNYLTFDPIRACFPAVWTQLSVDELPLLADLLTGGVYGSADRNRLHSSTMTLEAVRADRRGKSRAGLLKTLFPSAKDLQGRYPYLQTKPYLLGAAWVQRFIGFSKETRQKKTDPGKALQVGSQRIRLLQLYNIID